MGTMYLISAVMLLVAIILVKKTEKELNIISFFSISVVALFCYNTFICYILTFFTISITLLGLSLINLMFTLIVAIKILKDKKVQNYIFEKIDILYVLLILAIVLIVSYINFGYPFNVKYETGDPSVHYLTSVMFAESDALLAATEGDYLYGSFNVRKTVSYVNSGLLMKCLCPKLEALDCYSVFVCFGILTLFLTGLTMYAALTNIAKKTEHRLWAFVMAVICTLGYPLNSFLFGFEYLSMGLLIICAIIDLVYYHQNDILNTNFFIILMFLLSFGLFSAYYMFVPFIYPALWLYFCIQNYYKTKNIITKELVIILITTLLIPFILGYIYHLAPEIYSVFINNGKIENPMELSSHLVNSGLAVDGYIYMNLYSNMLLLLPLPIYLFIKDLKDNKLKNNSFMALAIVFCIAFIGLLLVGNYFEKVSLYYLSKNYFVLWILLLYCNYKALILLSEKGNYFPRLFISVYLLIIAIGTFFPDAKMENTLARRMTDVKETVLSVTDIFEVNNYMLFLKSPNYNRKELDILMYARENLDYDQKIEILSDDTTWTYVLLRYINKEPAFEGKFLGERYLIEKLFLLEENVKKADYIIYFNNSYIFKYFESIVFKNAETIYENEYGGIIKCKK